MSACVFVGERWYQQVVHLIAHARIFLVFISTLLCKRKSKYSQPLGLKCLFVCACVCVYVLLADDLVDDEGVHIISIGNRENCFSRFSTPVIHPIYSVCLVENKGNLSTSWQRRDGKLNGKLLSTNFVLFFHFLLLFSISAMPNENSM